MYEIKLTNSGPIEISRKSVAIMRCLGRLVSDTKGIGYLPFETGGFFHIPMQCDKVATDHKVATESLCALCEKRRERTEAKVAIMTGTSLQGTHPSYLHGLVTDPIPIWSHIYDGIWYRLKISSGSIISDSNMAKAKVAVAAIPIAPEPIIIEPVKKTRTKAKVTAKDTTKVTATTNADPVTVKPVVKFKVKSKAAKGDEIPLIATLIGVPVEPETIIHIDVKKVDIDGRQVYLDSSTDKVYDLKCKYIGRHDILKGCISQFPDSDAE